MMIVLFLSSVKLFSLKMDVDLALIMERGCIAVDWEFFCIERVGSLCGSLLSQVFIFLPLFLRSILIKFFKIILKNLFLSKSSNLLNESIKFFLSISKISFIQPNPSIIYLKIL